MSRLTAPSRLKAPNYSSRLPRQEGVTGPSSISKPSSHALPPKSPENRSQRVESQIGKGKVLPNQSIQHGTGPYDRMTQPSSTIPYVGKKRPLGVLKAPDSRPSAISKPQLTNGTAKMHEDVTTDSKITKKKIIQSAKSCENGALQKPVKRSSMPAAKSQGCGDLSKISTPRRQTVCVDTHKFNSKPAAAKSAIARTSPVIRPRSCIMPNKTSEIKKPDSSKKKTLSRSLQNIPKSTMQQPTISKGFNKKEIYRKSSSQDDILNCTKKVEAVPRSKGIPTSKFGFGKPPLERPRATTQSNVSTQNGLSSQSSTSLQSTASNYVMSTPISNLRKVHVNNLSPIIGTPVRPDNLDELSDRFPIADPMEESYKMNKCKLSNGMASAEINNTGDFVGVSDAVEMDNSHKTSDDRNETKTINIIINLDTVSQDLNTTTKGKGNNGLNATKEMNGTIDGMNTTKTLNESKNKNLNGTVFLNENNETSSLFNHTGALNNNDRLNQTRTMSNELNQTMTMNNELNQTRTMNNELNQTRTMSNELNQTRTMNNELNQTRTMNNELNQTRTMNNELNQTKSLNKTHSLGESFDENWDGLSDMFLLGEEITAQDRNGSAISKTSNGLNRTHVLEENIMENRSVVLEKSFNGLKENNVLDENIKEYLNRAHNCSNESNVMQLTNVLDKSDSGFDDTNFLNDTGTIPDYITSISPMRGTANYADLSHADLSEDIMKVINAISNNINRPSNPPSTDADDISQSTDVSQSTEQLQNCLSSIGTDTDSIEDIDIRRIKNRSALRDSYNTIGGGSMIGRGSRSGGGSRSGSISTSIAEKDIDEDDSDFEDQDIDIPVTDKEITVLTEGSEYSDVISRDMHGIIKDIIDTNVCQSNISTDINDNNINSVLSSRIDELNISDVKNGLFNPDEISDTSPINSVLSAGIKELNISDVKSDLFNTGERLPSPTSPTPSIQGTFSTPLSRQGSLESELTRRCNTIGCMRKINKIGRSRTYSSSELMTKFRIPKDLKCVETCDGDILMDKTTFLHFMNEVKLVKTSLLKLKRTLVEAPCTSPLLKSPLKRANSAVEGSTAPPLSPRTCQCSPMAVVNPLSIQSTGYTSTTKEKANLSSEEEIAMLVEKLRESERTIQLLQGAFDQKEQESERTIQLLQETFDQKEHEIRMLREECAHRDAIMNI